MRYGINSLFGLVCNRLGFDPMSRDVFIFLGKRSNQVRLLKWDRDGFALYIKKLKKGITLLTGSNTDQNNKLRNS